MFLDFFVFRKNRGCPEKFFDSQNGTLPENFLATGGGEIAEVEQRGAKCGRLTESPQSYATVCNNCCLQVDSVLLGRQ